MLSFNLTLLARVFYTVECTSEPLYNTVPFNNENEQSGENKSYRKLQYKEK